MSLSITNYDSPIGPIEIHATDTAVTRVEFAGEQRGENAKRREETDNQLSLLILDAARRASAAG